MAPAAAAISASFRAPQLRHVATSSVPHTQQGVKANMREKAQNTVAKAEQKWDSAKASAAEKTEKFMAADKVGKEEAHARKHEKEAEAYREKEQKKSENHADKLSYKEQTHDTTPQNIPMSSASNDLKTGIPTSGNPYVQTPVATTPTSVPHPHLVHGQTPADGGFPEDKPSQGTKAVLPHDDTAEPTNEQVSANPGFPEDQPSRCTKAVVPQDRMSEPTTLSGFEEFHGHHQPLPEADQQNDPQSRANYGVPAEQPTQNDN